MADRRTHGFTFKSFFFTRQPIRKPYYRYIDNEQYVYQLHCIGQGEYDIEQIRIEDTPISSFEEITCQVIRPSEKNTLFDEDVITSAEVAGQELLKGEICGPFILNSAETMITKIEVDVAFQRGCYYANDSGGLSSKTIQWKIFPCNKLVVACFSVVARW